MSTNQKSEMKNQRSGFGWAGKLLWVDLTDRKITRVPTSDFEPDKFIGGQGLNSKIYWELGCPQVDAFHPDSPLILSNGPLTGASGPFTRATVCGKAPQCYPKELFSHSGFGGKFPSELKYAGYDGVVLVGRSDKPVYLLILDDTVEIRDAADLWGLDTYETQQSLSDRYPRASILTIGPAGENLSRIAVILNETSSAAGQGGYGGVMGSKNLKAIVTRGTGTLKIADPDALLGLIAQRKSGGDWEGGWNQHVHRSPLVGGTIPKEWTEKYRKKFSGCYACPFQCNGWYDVPGMGRGSEMCVSAFYGYFNQYTPKGAWEGNILSQKLGINQCDLMGILMFLKDAVSLGLVKLADIGLPPMPMNDQTFSGVVQPTMGEIPIHDPSQVGPGSEPAHGSDAVHHQFLEAFFKGIADGTSPFAQGAARAAEVLGPDAVEVYNTHYPVSGQISHSMKNVSMALMWAMETRDPFNSCHDAQKFTMHKEVAEWFGTSKGYFEEGGGKKNQYEGVEREAVWVQDHQCLKNSLLTCEFGSAPELYFHPPEMDIGIFESRLLSAVTGIDYDVDEFWKAGERIWNLRRAIMILEDDRSRDADTLNHNYFERICPTGSALPESLDRTKFEALKDRYYRLRGWDVGTGRLTRAKLESLHMRDIADRLDSAGKLGGA